MYKVLLVDDEPWALRGIKETFQWKEMGFEVMYETTKSTEALEIILKGNVDVVFTDIRMPKISGLELMKKAREQGNDNEFIVISGYGEFSYAQEALKQGAFDYCLKPLQFEEADILLKRLKKHMDKKVKTKATKLLEEIIEDNENIGNIMDKYLSKCNYKYFQAVVVHGKFTLPLNIKNLMIELGGDKALYLFNIDKSIEFVLTEENTSGAIIGISSISNYECKALELYQKADSAACSFFIYNKNGIYCYKKKNIHIINELVKDITIHIRNKSDEEIRTAVENIPDSIRANQLTVEDLCYLWNQIVSFLYRNYSDKLSDLNVQFMDYEQVIKQFAKIEELSEFMLDSIFSASYKKNNYITSVNSNSDFTKMINYIEEHYYGQLFLRELAKQFYINQNYCCYLFKKFTGGTFSDYINKLRIEKSKFLLEETALTIEQISQKVGYNDYFYYNKVFKKYFGTTPSKYRKDTIAVNE